MAKVRKKNNARKRLMASTDALLHQGHIVIVDIMPMEKHGLLNWKKCQPVRGTVQLVNGVCDLPHQWTIYLAVFCLSQTGERYIKGEEIEPQGRYKSEHINDAITQCHDALIATCNPGHVIGYGWIASPTGESLTEEQAARVFDCVGCWEQTAAA